MTWTTVGSSVIFKPYSLDEALRGLAEAGFDGIELGAVYDFHRHLDPDQLGASEITHARELLGRYGLQCVSMSGHAQLHTDEGMGRVSRVLEASSELGARVLNTFTGDPTDDQERATLIDNARILADRAQTLGVRLCIENDSNLMPSAEVGLALLDEIGHDWIQINYDPANVIYFAGVSPVQDVQFALKRLGHVHMKDKRGGKGVADFPPLGEGELDVPTFLRAFRGIDYSGPLSIEIEFRNWEWPSWEECRAAAVRSREYYESVMRTLARDPAG
jgi:sugar phosphate isomerase/epimerase